MNICLMTKQLFRGRSHYVKVVKQCLNVVNTVKQNVPFLFQNDCTKRKSYRLLKHHPPGLNQIVYSGCGFTFFLECHQGLHLHRAFLGLVYCQHFFSSSFLIVSREAVLIAPTIASRDVIFPNCWFCLAEWSWLSIAIPDNFTLNVQTHKAIRRLSEEIPPAAGFPVRAEPDLRTVRQKCLPDLASEHIAFCCLILFEKLGPLCHSTGTR